MSTLLTSRRGLLGAGALLPLAGGAAGLASRAQAQTAEPPAAPPALPIPSLLAPAARDGVKTFDLDLRRGETELLPGRSVATLGINGGYLGPTLRAHQGDSVALNVVNRTGEPTTLHWHGMHLPPSMDGGPHQIIPDGATWTPRFAIRQQAATLWCHAHLMGQTQSQVGRGLAGMFILDDDNPAQELLPHTYGVDDLPLILQDRAADGGRRGRGPAATLVNGAVSPAFATTRPRVRLRLLNASGQRFYTFGLAGDLPFAQVASDGGLLPAPVRLTRLTLGPAERAELVVDVTDTRPALLQSFGGQGGGGFGGAPGQAQTVLTVTSSASIDPPALPAQLNAIEQRSPSAAAVTRDLVLCGNGGQRTINGHFMASMDAMHDMAATFRVRLGDTEVWNVVNTTRQTHVFHVHDVQFQILDRTSGPLAPNESGRKDTVLARPGETVRLLLSFADYADPDVPYMFHCHILQHEDQGMMGQFLVVSEHASRSTPLGARLSGQRYGLDRRGEESSGATVSARRARTRLGSSGKGAGATALYRWASGVSGRATLRRILGPSGRVRQSESGASAPGRFPGPRGRRKAMEISGITVYLLPGTRYPWVFLRLETDTGRYGIGQVSSGPNAAVVAAAASKLGPLLVGEDPSRIEYLWYKVYSSFNSLGSLGFASALLSGVDIALWDLRGKALGLPVYELLGGRFRDRLVLYSNGWFSGCRTPDEFARAAKKTVDEGHTALKLDPFKQNREDFRKWGAGYDPADDVDAVQIIAAIRESVGPGVDVLIDAHGRFDVPTAVRLANKLAPHGIGWFEEPVPPENADALRQFRARSSVPVCVGERLYTRWQFRSVLEQQLAEYIMPDVIRTGGISELRKIATMAEAFFVPVSPHDATGPITLIAGAQTMMATSNFYRLEIAYSELAQYNQAMTPPFDVRGGHFYVSDRPGLGHDLSEDYLRQAIPFS